MPTVYQAEILVKNNLETFRRQGVKAFKIIHGYGSTGKGGALRTANWIRCRTFNPMIVGSNPIET